MNGYWFPWGMERFDNTPERFKKAWWRIYNIFRGPGGVGATNVKFVWSPIAPCGRCASYSSLYPGDSYVQFASFSAFNWGTPKPWKSMVTKFRPAMDALAGVTSKKVIVAETGSSTAGGSQAAWVREGYRAAYKRWPKIKAIVYFNLDMRFADQPDWRLTYASGSLGEYRTLLTKTKFQGRLK
jgi:beta-mannanase